VVRGWRRCEPGLPTIHVHRRKVSWAVSHYSTDRIDFLGHKRASLLRVLAGYHNVALEARVSPPD
jgi:hypothetical protein